MIALTKGFVCAADEVWRLQRGTDAECRFFQSFADQAHYRGKGGTRQGIYIIAPSGLMMGSLNSLNADAVSDALEISLKHWDKLTPAERKLAEDADMRAAHRWESNCPTDGLVLRITSRDCKFATLDCGSELPCTCERWNRDHAWFTAEEATGWLPAEITVGASVDVAAPIVERLARFHFVDNVRGQTLPFAAVEVAGSTLRTQVTAVDADGTCHIDITGRIRGECNGEWVQGENEWTPSIATEYGVEVNVVGRAAWNPVIKRFTAFDMVANGSRWGANKNNGRKGMEQPTPIGYYLQLAPTTPAGRIAPAFVNVYNASWISRPRVRPPC